MLNKFVRESKALLISGALVVGVISGLAMNYVIGGRCDVVGDSMMPTYYDGDVILLDKMITPKRGSLIVVKTERETIIKRLIGMPGDIIQIIDGLVYINGEYYKEDYIYKNDTEYSGGIADEPLELGGDEYFIMGDNRQVSYDSRFMGAIKRDQIIGVVLDS